MKKNTRNVLITILIITGLTYIPTLTFPLFLGPKIDPGRSYTTNQSGNQGFYRLHVSKGEYYSLSIHWDHSDFSYPIVEIYSRTMKLYGIHRISSTVSDFSIRFQAKHSGFYYLTIGLPDGGSFHLNLEQISENVYYIINYNHDVNSRRIILYVVSALLCLLVVVIPPFMRFVNKKKKEYEQSLILYCPVCGVKLGKSIGYCSYCGHTFASPKTNKY